MLIAAHAYLASCTQFSSSLAFSSQADRLCGGSFPSAKLSQIISTAPSMTIAKELLEVDTAGNEVHVQDRGEHVPSNSMAASEINEDVGVKKQGEESEEETLPAAKSHCQVRPHHISMTMPNELPEMDTDKNVHAQDGKEHVAFNSMADVVSIRRSVRLRPTTRTTDPLSVQIGVRRKIPTKKKKGYLKNRLE